MVPWYRSSSASPDNRLIPPITEEDVIKMSIVKLHKQRHVVNIVRRFGKDYFPIDIQGKLKHVEIKSWGVKEINRKEIEQ